MLTNWTRYSAFTAELDDSRSDDEGDGDETEDENTKKKVQPKKWWTNILLRAANHYNFNIRTLIPIFMAWDLNIRSLSQWWDSWPGINGVDCRKNIRKFLADCRRNDSKQEIALNSDKPRVGTWSLLQFPAFDFDFEMLHVCWSSNRQLYTQNHDQSTLSFNTAESPAQWTLQYPNISTTTHKASYATWHISSPAIYGQFFRPNIEIRQTDCQLCSHLPFFEGQKTKADISECQIDYYHGSGNRW